MPTKLKSVLINLGLGLVSTVLFVLVMELVFPKILHKLPLSIYLGLGKDYKILGQHHKKSVSQPIILQLLEILMHWVRGIGILKP
ncbi:MAG: hypothetical protein OSA44_11515 [Nitrospinaceae bacterium]|nr:hypothetical protein [Nitrospinaceae bacterium]